MAEEFYSSEQKEQIIAAIRAAELNTSGEIQVHLEEKCPGNDAFARAKKIFERMGMHKTAQRNAVLFYLAHKDHVFAILGDKGINEAVEENFWDSTRAEMESLFRQGQFSDGLCHGIHRAGEKLKAYFPYQKDDKNELPDEISFGKDKESHS